VCEQVLTCLGERLPEEEMDRLLRRVDRGGSGQVNMEKFVTVMMSKGSS
jgi:Ca2+-binding EF-hand superfamily protein